MKARTSSIAVAALAIAGAALAADPPRPVGLVEQVSDAPAAKLQRFDYLYPGAQIDLRPSGTLAVAWFDSCVVETFTGGQVKLEKARARVSGGGKAQRRGRPCPTSALKLAPSRSEAGVAVKRVTPFEEGRWAEITVAALRPTFLWPPSSRGAEANVTISFLDAKPKTQVWKGTAPGTMLDYPASAPALAVGAPYEVLVERPGEAAISAVFSIDPGLAFEAGTAAAVVPLGL